MLHQMAQLDEWQNRLKWTGSQLDELSTQEIVKLTPVIEEDEITMSIPEEEEEIKGSDLTIQSQSPVIDMTKHQTLKLEEAAQIYRDDVRTEGIINKIENETVEEVEENKSKYSKVHSKIQLDLEMGSPDKSMEKILPVKKSEVVSPEDVVESMDKFPKLINANIGAAINDHFETLEDYEESYETRYNDLASREELIIVENDIKQCTDLAQQFFYHHAHIGSTLNKFCKELKEKQGLLLDSVPTDPPTSPSTYYNFTPIRRIIGLNRSHGQDPLHIVALIGWEGCILEMLNTAKTGRSHFDSSLRKKLTGLIYSIENLKTLLKACIKVGEKVVKSMTRIWHHVERLFDPQKDPMKEILSRVPSSNPIIFGEEQEGTKEQNSILEDPREGEASILVTARGVYFNQFGVAFASRLDITSKERQLRIIELFLNHIQSQIQVTTSLVQDILTKFGKDTFPAETWWRFSQPFIPVRVKPYSLLIEGNLEEHVYNKTIFHLMKNLENSFIHDNIKSHLTGFGELEILILLRSTRIMEEEILQFGKMTTEMYQRLVQLDKFQRFFKRSFSKFFRSQLVKGSYHSPFTKWAHRISCFKLVIKDDQIKRKLDWILMSTASENLFTSSSAILTTKKSKSSLNNENNLSTVLLLLLEDMNIRWKIRLKDALKSLYDQNSFLPNNYNETTINSQQIQLSTLWTREEDDSYLSHTEGISICLASAVTQLNLENFPRHSKAQLVKKLKTLVSKVMECLTIINHGIEVCSGKREEISKRLGDILNICEPTHSPPREEVDTRDDPGFSLTQEVSNFERQIRVEEENEQDVYVSLHFALEGVILSYRGCERSTPFRSKKLAEQFRIIDIMMEFVADRLTEIVYNIRKISLEYVRLNGNVKKLVVKIDKSVPVTVLPEIQRSLLSLRRVSVEDWPMMESLIKSAEVTLSQVESHLNLTVRFLDKYIELDKSEEDTSKYNKNPTIPSTFTVQNPLEKDIQELFTKPIRIVIPHHKFDLRLW